MLGQFSIYPEIKWMATVEAQGYVPGDNMQRSPDLENFKLESVEDLRKQPVNKDLRLKLRLNGSNKTIVYITAGPDSLLDDIFKRLPKYKGKSWSEINSMPRE